jgi:uncharacterized protein YdeI (YjbR/CyaY-like superfamily)
MDTATLPVKLFETQSEFEEWLCENGSTTTEVWLKMYKKSSEKKSLNHDQALEVALCYGWIDGIAHSYDAESHVQRFTPRTKKSKWSKVNTQHVERLISEGKMHEQGLKVIEDAKADGRWDAAYDSPKNASFPPEFLEMLEKNEKAKVFFDTLKRTNIYAMTYRLQNAKKPETKDRLMNQFIEMLERGETFH